MASTRLDLRYGLVPIGGVQQLLPVRAEARVGLNKRPRKNVAEFSGFRQYRAESKIEFEVPKEHGPPPFWGTARIGVGLGEA